MPVTPLSLEAQEALSSRGYLTSSGRLRRGDIADSLAALMESNHVVNSTQPARVRQYAATLDELTVATLGLQDPALRYLIAQLTAPTLDGPVQQRLRESVLCSYRVDKVVQATEGLAITRAFTCRFVAKDPEVLYFYLVQPQLEQMQRRFVTMNSLLQLALKRQPRLATRMEQIRSDLPGRIMSTFASAS